MMAIAQAITAHSRRLIQKGLMRFGYRVVSLTRDEIEYWRLPAVASDDQTGPVAELHPANPRLVELRKRYAAVRLPMAERTTWGSLYLERGLRLAKFRANNVYLLQYRSILDNARKKYYLIARYVADQDPRGLLKTLGEDGAFGCSTFDYHSLGTISRDLFDSVNELYFLDRAMGIFDRQGLQVLDIGAGYGRLGHRMSTALPGLGRYYCVDAVPESTFLSEFYLKHRGCTGKTTVVAMDRLHEELRGARVDLAVNIHSFSEMGYAAIEGWLRLVAELDVPNLLIVPNEPDQLLSTEVDGTRCDFMPLLATLGYRLKVKEPVLLDPDIRELVWIHDHFFFFERPRPA